MKVCYDSHKQDLLNGSIAVAENIYICMNNVTLISRVSSFLAQASKEEEKCCTFFILMFGLFGLDVNLKPKYLSGNIVSRNGYSWRLIILYLFNE